MSPRMSPFCRQVSDLETFMLYIRPALSVLEKFDIVKNYLKKIRGYKSLRTPEQLEVKILYECRRFDLKTKRS